jgi:arylformamidase
MAKKFYLSYVLDENTPTYGNRNKFNLYKKSSILNGDIANDSFIETTVHIGTHIDMPYHFYENGQRIEDFDVEYFYFSKVLFLELNPNELVIKDELIDLLKETNNKDSYDSIIVKTGICYKRKEEIFWKKNYGFHPEVAYYIRENFPKVRVFGFDSISVSSFANRMIGREVHKVFLNPEKPILLIEDMDLRKISQKNRVRTMIVAPLRISKCDGIPCTIVGEIE